MKTKHYLNKHFTVTSLKDNDKTKQTLTISPTQKGRENQEHFYEKPYRPGLMIARPERVLSDERDFSTGKVPWSKVAGDVVSKGGVGSTLFSHRLGDMLPVRRPKTYLAVQLWLIAFQLE